METVDSVPAGPETRCLLAAREGEPCFKILFDRTHNRSFPEKEHNMYRVASWTQVYQMRHKAPIFSHGEYQDLIHANLID